MSWEVYNWVSAQKTGDPVSRAVLHAIANWMNPQGDPCCVSMKQLADEVEISVRTAQRHITRLEAMGLVVRQLQQREDRGQGWSTFVFPTYLQPRVAHITPPTDAPAITPALADNGGKEPFTDHDKLSFPPTTDCHSPRDNLSPSPHDNLSPSPRQSVTPPATDCHGPHDTVVGGENYKGLNITPLSPPRGAEEIFSKRDKGERIPEAWVPPSIEELSDAAQLKARQWPPGAYEAEAETFRSHWMAESGRSSYKLDWTAAWVSHIMRWTARVLQDHKAGVKFAAPRTKPAKLAPTPAHDTSRESEAAKKIRKALAKRVNAAAISQFFDKCRFDVTNDGLTIVGPSEFTLSYAREAGSREAQLAMHDVLGPDADLNWRVEKRS